MAPTDGRVVRPEWQWGCHRGTPLQSLNTDILISH